MNLDKTQQNIIVVSVIPDFGPDGNLPEGEHRCTWAEFCERFGKTGHRRGLIAGLRIAALSLKRAGCRRLWVDGSFVTSKEVPRDFDACWDELHVDGAKLDPVLLDFSNARAAQKVKFGGELFPAGLLERGSGRVFRDFFKVDRSTGEPKGIVVLDLTQDPL